MIVRAKVDSKTRKPIHEDGFPRLVSAIVEQAISDIQQAYDWSVDQLIFDTNLLMRGKNNQAIRRSKDYQKAQNRMWRWKVLDAEGAVEFLLGDYWEWIASTAGMDPDSLPRTLKQKIRVVQSRIKMVQEFVEGGRAKT